MKLKAMLLILAITSLPFIFLELVNPKLDLFSGSIDAGQSAGICALFETPCLSWHLVSPDANLSITIANGFDKPIVVTKISCSKSQDNFVPCGQAPPEGRPTVCDLKNPSADSVRIGIGDSNEFLLSCTDENGQAVKIGRGDAYSGKINIEYVFPGETSGQPNRIHGTIVEEAG